MSEYDTRYSYKDYTGHSLKHLNLTNCTVYASCFSQEKPDTQIFSDDTSNVTFIRCNLTNVTTPPNSTVIDCVQKRILVQNDLRDWEIDENDNPIAVVNAKYWESVGVSVNPSDIPAQKIIMNENDYDLVAKLQQVLGVQ